ncbi:16S rRNA (cytosine(1402)-N(4))-methyltransferase RsmH [Flavobacteriaceae bacterium]|nr:16S rRNA (cytosine(1402)-N(4))-methyltransferase RsmH [Flavobacteriaceae bacterium]
MSYHDPVLLSETVAGLAIKPDGIYVDVTFGGGGHSRHLLSQLGPNGRLIAFDQDQDALDNRIDDPRFLLIHQNFRYLKRFLKFHGITQVDGIMGDFGVSSHQFDEGDRGFSTRFDGALDMRMNQEQGLTAAQILNEYSVEQLTVLFREYGELRNGAKLSRVIEAARKEKMINTTEELKSIVRPFMPRNKEHKIMAQIFQAIRLEVNQELAVLKEFLLQTKEVIKPSGRLSLISYHSLEDRLVKRFMRHGLFEGMPEKDVFGRAFMPFKPVGKLIVPSAQEIEKNNRARSAKLRIAQRTDEV